VTATNNKNQANNGNTDTKDDIVVMDVTMLHEGRVKTLKPTITLNRDTNIIHISSYAAERNHTEKERPLWLQKLPWLHRAADAVETPGFRKKMREAAVIIIIGIIVGLTAVLIDSYSYKKSGTTILLDRLDRLIRAVEMDWGR
jgi:chemotaxis response regulator CheB